MEFTIRGRERNGRSVQIASTASAIKAKAMRDSQTSPWADIRVAGPDGPLTNAELDVLAEKEQQRCVSQSD